MNYTLQLKSQDTGSYFPLRGDYQDSYDTQAAAEVQASTLSLLPQLVVNAWGGPACIRRAEGAFSIVVIAVRGWFVISEFNNGGQS